MRSWGLELERRFTIMATRKDQGKSMGRTGHLRNLGVKRNGKFVSKSGFGLYVARKLREVSEDTKPEKAK